MFDLDTYEHLKKLKTDYVGTLKPSERIPALECKQRFGFIPVTLKRKMLLEKGFINPNFLSELKKKYPNGLPSQPNAIIWPTDRNIELDLNYNVESQVYIRDLNPNFRLDFLSDEIEVKKTEVKPDRK